MAKQISNSANVLFQPGSIAYKQKYFSQIIIDNVEIMLNIERINMKLTKSLTQQLYNTDITSKLRLNISYDP